MNDTNPSVDNVPAMVSASNTKPAPKPRKPRKSAATASPKERATSEQLSTVRKPRKPATPRKAAKMVALASIPMPEPFIAVQDAPKERTSLKALSIGLSLIAGLLVLASLYGSRLPNAQASHGASFHAQAMEGLNRTPY